MRAWAVKANGQIESVYICDTKKEAEEASDIGGLVMHGNLSLPITIDIVPVEIREIPSPAKEDADG